MLSYTVQNCLFLLLYNKKYKGDILYDNLLNNIHKKTKDIQCIDCGEWFEVDVKDNETCRCSECRDEHVRKLARLRKQKQRKREMSRAQTS